MSEVWKSFCLVSGWTLFGSMHASRSHTWSKWTGSWMPCRGDAREIVVGWTKTEMPVRSWWMCCSVDLPCPCKGAGGGAFADRNEGVAVGAGAARWTTPDLL